MATSELAVFQAADLTAVPECSGCYLLFNQDLEVIYIGKASSLRERLAEHLNSETNVILRKAPPAYFFYVDAMTPEQAEELEGSAYDQFIILYGKAPKANINKPPKATKTGFDLTSILGTILHKRV